MSLGYKMEWSTKIYFWPALGQYGRTNTGIGDPWITRGMCIIPSRSAKTVTEM